MDSYNLSDLRDELEDVFKANNNNSPERLNRLVAFMGHVLLKLLEHEEKEQIARENDEDF